MYAPILRLDIGFVKYIIPISNGKRWIHRRGAGVTSRNSVGGPHHATANAGAPMTRLADDIQDGKHPRGKVRKRFTVQARFTSGPFKRLEWRVWRRYETAEQRDAALESLQGKESRRTYGGCIEYRAGPGNGG